MAARCVLLVCAVAGYATAFPFFNDVAPNPVADVPIIGAMTGAVPSLRDIPGLSFIPKPSEAQAGQVRDLNNAIEQFSLPLIRLSTGNSHMIAEDFDQVLQAMPLLAVKPQVDFSLLSPEMQLRAFRGEDVQGITKVDMESSLRAHILRIYEAAERNKSGNSLSSQPADSQILNSVPQDIVADIVRGAKLPYLSEDQMKVVKDYYAPKVSPNANETPKNGLSLDDLELSPELFQMVKLLPRGYDINKIPKDVVMSITRGEIPDLGLLPADLQQHFMDNFQHLYAKFAKESMRVEDVLKKLPNFEKVEARTFSPYEEETVGSGAAPDTSGKSVQYRLFQYGIILLVVASIVSLIVLGAFCFQRRRTSRADATEQLLKRSAESSFTASTPEVARPKPTASRMEPHLPPFYNTPNAHFPRRA